MTPAIHRGSATVIGMRAFVGVVGVLAAAGLLVAVVAVGAGSRTAADRDCSDFANQADAQAFFDAHRPGDPHQLDSDGDGIACETNPCPCAKPGGGGAGGGDRGGKARKARVRAITDGDTIDVRVSGHRDTVRIIGIDTPERGQCGYTEATRSLARTLRIGERVKLRPDGTQPARDRYGRLLRYVEDGRLDAGRKQLLRGWARVLIVGRGFDRLKSYRKAVRKAKAKDRGIWSRC